MSSLRWRIAAAYAALFVVAISFASIAISFAFRTVLLDQAHSRSQAVSTQIRRTMSPFGIFGAQSDLAVLATIANQDNLESWASPTTLVQIDNAQGQPVGKSTNTGSFFFPPDHELTVATPTRSYTTDDLFILDEALIESGRIVAVAHVGERLDALREALDSAREILFAVTLIAIVVVVLASILIASLVLEPVKRLTATMEGIGSERLDRRVGWTGRRDELGRLAAAFDRMLDRLQGAFARERQFISDASHELKTPLTVINANAQMLRRWAERDEAIRAESLQAIVDESAGLASMVSGMLLLAKADSGDDIPKDPVDLNAAAREAIDALRGKAAEKGLELVFEPSTEPAIVSGESGLLRQLFSNLIDNAIKFTERGSVAVRVRVENGEATGEVIDTGVGIDDAALGRVFDRFYRADKSRNRAVEGTGLGLAIVRSIARVHGGRVHAAKGPNGGSMFSASFPLDPQIIESQ